MATHKYKSKKQLSKKHGKKSKNHKKQVKKTRKYRKKRGGLGAMANDEDYLPQYGDIMDTLEKIGEGNKFVDRVVPGQFSDKKTQMKPTDMLEQYLDMNNTVSCGRRILTGDKQNCNQQKNKLYKNIKAKIVETKEKINSQENSSLTDEEVEAINKTLTTAHNHFGTKMSTHA